MRVGAERNSQKNPLVFEIVLRNLHYFWAGFDFTFRSTTKKKKRKTNKSKRDAVVPVPGVPNETGQ